MEKESFQFQLGMKISEGANIVHVPGPSWLAGRLEKHYTCFSQLLQ
jgi:hypothetical protein